MRQLRAIGWMHNRVRMIAASFLVKDLHVEWQHGGRHFMQWLVDGDLASNMHGWQWVAGSGTDPSPYFRIFNPTTQGAKFDPDGVYVRRWVPELRDVRHEVRPRAVPRPRRSARRLPRADRGPQGRAGRVAAPLREDQEVTTELVAPRPVQRPRPVRQRRLHVRRRSPTSCRTPRAAPSR